MEPERRGAASIAIGDEHLALAQAVRRFVAERCSPPVVRAAIDASDRGMPAFLQEMAELGWLGGEGFGMSEAAIVAEELGRGMVLGPMLASFWAGVALRVGGGPEPLLRALASGEICGSVALSVALEGRSCPDGSVAVTGSTGPVISGDLAGVVIVAVLVDGTEYWYAAEKDAFTATPLDPFDPTRSVAELHFHEAILDAGSRIEGLDRRWVDALTYTLAAAECAGIASWCVDMAAAFACDRHQFGRPIGQFQAVKHRCADMLAAAESIRSLAWDGARAVDQATGWGADDDGGVIAAEEVALATASAAVIALDAAVKVAEDCIQVLGGIGFTWDHDAHLYLRRAIALRQLLGGSARARRSVGEAALAGTRRRLRVALPPDAEPLRTEIRAEVEEIAGLDAQQRRARLMELGLLVPHWPEPWGRGAGAIEQLVIDEELQRARVRRPHLQVGAWAAPTIVAHGTEAQQERWVRPTLLGTISWCQLFSEPEAGSDLAALRTAGTRTAGGWLLDGQKVWTTMAAEADWGICLIRTNTHAAKHLGITYVIVDMRSDGIDVRPLKEMTGLTMFNEVFFDGVFVPDDCVIGEVDGGWPLVRTTLGNERVAMGSGSSFGGGIEALLSLIVTRRDLGEIQVDDLLLDELGMLVAESHVVAALGARAAHRSVAGAGPGPESSIRKLLSAEHDQRTQEFGLGLLGPWGTTVEGDAAQWTFGFLANRCLTIAGGTSEIQRNVIGERLLGLPRDPEPA